MLATTGNPAFCRLIGEECLPVFLRWTMPYDYSEQAQQSRPLRLEEGPTTEACEGFMRWPLQTQLFRQRELCLTHILRYCNGASLTSLRQASAGLAEAREVQLPVKLHSQFTDSASSVQALPSSSLLWQDLLRQLGAETWFPEHRPFAHVQGANRRSKPKDFATPSKPQE